MDSKARVQAALERASRVQGILEGIDGDLAMLDTYDAVKEQREVEEIVGEIQQLALSMVGHVDELAYRRISVEKLNVEGEHAAMGVVWGEERDDFMTSLGEPKEPALFYRGQGDLVLLGNDGVVRFVEGTITMHSQVDPMPVWGEFGQTVSAPAGADVFSFKARTVTVRAGLFGKKRRGVVRTLDEKVQEMGAEHVSGGDLHIEYLKRMRDGMLLRIEYAHHEAVGRQAAIAQELEEKKLPVLSR